MKERGKMMLKGKTVVLAVTGSIAAYKIASLASTLKKLEADVHVLMTENAENFIHPITFETLTGNKCLIDTFDRNFQYSVEHVSLAKLADVVMIAPASANVIGKVANGIADDMLTTTVMACRCKKIVVPAMNTNMFVNPIVQDNLDKLRHFGYEVVDPATGYLACGDTGQGKMPEPKLLLEYILKEIQYEKDLAGKRVLVTAGPTQEAIDPVRFLTNHSTGKMGYALATVCMRRGADVTLVTGPTQIEKPKFVRMIPVRTAKQMFDAVTEHAGDQDIIIKAAAVVPLFIGFTSAGLPLGVTFSFLISSPMVDLGSLVLLMSIFGAKVAVVYVILGLVIAVIGGSMIEKLRMEKYVESFVLSAGSVDIESPDLTIRERLTYAKEQMLGTFKKVFPYTEIDPPALRTTMTGVCYNRMV